MGPKEEYQLFHVLGNQRRKRNNDWSKKQAFRPHPLYTKVVSAEAPEAEEAVAGMDIRPLYVVRWWWHQRPCLGYP